MDRETAKAINNVSQRLNEVSAKMDKFAAGLNKNTQAIISNEFKGDCKLNEYVMYNGVLYKAIQEFTGEVLPTDSTYFKECNIAEELNYLRTIIEREG